MAIVKSKNPAMRNRQVILPIVGKIEYNDKCEFEVKNIEDAKELVSIDSLQLELALTSKELNKLETEAKKQEATDKERGVLDQEEAKDFSKDSEENVELLREEKIAFIEGVETMNELKELAASFPQPEWINLKSKAKMKEYLISKC